MLSILEHVGFEKNETVSDIYMLQQLEMQLNSCCLSNAVSFGSR